MAPLRSKLGPDIATRGDALAVPPRCPLAGGLGADFARLPTHLPKVD